MVRRFRVSFDRLEHTDINNHVQTSPGRAVDPSPYNLGCYASLLFLGSKKSRECEDTLAE